MSQKMRKTGKTREVARVLLYYSKGFFWQEKIMTLGTKLEGWTRARDILEALDTFEGSERAYDFSTGLKLSQCANVLL